MDEQQNTQNEELKQNELSEEELSQIAGGPTMVEFGIDGHQ